MTIFFTAVVFLFALAPTLSSVIDSKGLLHVPDYYQACPRYASDVDSCILNSLRNMHPHFVKGIPELKLPPMDPFRLEESELEYKNGRISAKLIVRDFVSYGIRDLQYNRVRTDFRDLDNIKLDIEVFIPKIRSDGKYKFQGRLMKSEFGGKGTYNVTMTNIKSTWKITGSQVEIDGINYLRINHVDMEPVVGDMKFYASNLFNGNEALSRTAVKLINQNWRLVYKELLPFLKKDWDKMMTEFANKLLLKVPFDEIFPPSA